MHWDWRGFGAELIGALARIVAYLCAIAGLAVVAVDFIGLSPGIAAVDPQGQADWADIGRRYQAFSVGREPDETEARHFVRRHPIGGGRKDVVTWGKLGGSAGMIEVYRPGSEIAAFSDDPTEVAVRSGLELGGPITGGDALDTKFGPFWLFEFTARGDATARRCAGFVRNFDEPRLQIAGWTCNAGLELVDRGALACLLDRLTVVSAGSDPKTAELFAHAELKRSFCGQKSPVLYTTPKRNEWLDAREPKLRGIVRR